MLKVAICDVDMQSRRRLRLLCEKYMEEKQLEGKILQYSSGEDMLIDGYPDILFLDVRLKRLNGLLVKEILSKTKAETRMIFVSENKNYISDAFGRYVYGFFVKPVKEERIFQKLDEIVDDIMEEKRYVFCKRDKNIERVHFKDIYYIESCGRHTKVCARNREKGYSYWTADLTLKKWKEILLTPNFVYINKKQIVNLLYVVDIKSEIELVNQIKLPIGTAYQKHLWERYDGIKKRRTVVHRDA